MMHSNKISLRLFGIFFILSFIFYATGIALIEPHLYTFEKTSDIYLYKNQILAGAFLITFCHTFANIGLVVVMFSIFKEKFRIEAYSYLSAAITSTVFLAIGGVFFALLIPLSEVAVGSSTIALPEYEILGKLLKNGQFYFYQFGMQIWAVAGLILCNMLLKASVVERWLPITGFVGYVIFFVGCVCEVFEIHIGTVSSLIGGLFEITLSLILIFRSYRPKARVKTI